MIKLIALDLDHTLLDVDKTIDSQTLQYLKNLNQQGQILVLATGRATATTAYYAGLIGNEVHCVTYNGSVLYSRQMGREDLGLLSQEQIQALVSYARNYNLFLQFYDGDVIVVEKPCKELYRDPDLQHISFRSIGNFDDYPPFTSPKAMIVLPEEDVRGTMEDLRKNFGTTIAVTQSEGNLIEILPGGVSKKNSLEVLCQRLSIDAHEVLAIGDNLNDLEMITWAQYGCAVDNAIPLLKEKAVFISKSPRSMGVLEILQHYFEP